MTHKKQINFESLFGFAITDAKKKGDTVGVGFQFNVSDNYSKESKLVMIQNILDTFAYPEVMKRIEAGKIDSKFRIRYVQILMYSDHKKNEILLNDEVRLILNITFKDKKSFNLNEIVTFDKIDKILGIYPSSKNHPNAAHIMLVNINRKWYFAANLVYNRKSVEEKFSVSHDYMKVVKNALEESNWNPLVDNLFTVTELSVQCILELHHHNKHSHTQTHPSTRKLFKAFCENRNAPIEFFNHYEQLVIERKKARYLRGTHGKKYSLTKNKAENYLGTTNNMLKYTENLLKMIDIYSKPSQGQYIAIGNIGGNTKKN